MPMEEPPAPTLVGTWEFSSAWTDREGVSWSGDYRLTFTAGDRAVLISSYYSDGVFDNSYYFASGWKATDSTVTRLWYGDFTYDDDVDNPIHGSIDKSYFWTTEDRSAVFLEGWGAIEPSSIFEKWERVPADRLPSIIGNWHFERTNWRRTLEMRPDGYFEIVATNKHDGRVETWRGMAELDLETYTATITNFALEIRDAAGNVTQEATPRGDGNARMAFVPSARGFSMSLWQEGDEDYPYGHYWLHLEPAGQ